MYTECVRIPLIDAYSSVLLMNNIVIQSMDFYASAQFAAAAFLFTCLISFYCSAVLTS